MRARLLAVTLAALAALAAWLTLGVLAVVDTATVTRVWALPPVWMLLALEATLVGAVDRRRLPAARLWPLALTALVCLPWLPGRIPAAFLIWYGRMAVLIWLLVALGLAGPSVNAAMRPSWLSHPRRAPWLAGLAALVAFAGGAMMIRGRLPAGDEPHYLIIAQSLLKDGDLRIENNHQRGDYYDYSPNEIGPHYLQRGQDGQIYSIHAPGLAVLVAPAFAVAGWLGAVATVVLLAALAVALFWFTAWRLTDGNAGAAWMAAAALALSSPVFFHAFTLFPDGVGAACIAVALWTLVELNRGALVGRHWLVASGAALAVLPWLHTRFAVAAASFGLVLCARLWRRPARLEAIGALLAVPIASALGWFTFFWWIWGTANPAAPYGAATQTALAHLTPGLLGLLFDQQFGLLPNAPIYAAAVVSLVAVARQFPRLASEIAFIVVPYVLTVASYRMWWGGYSAPARFLVCVLPLPAIMLAVGWARAGAYTRAVVGVLLTVSIVSVWVRASVDGGALIYNQRDGYDLLLDWANRSVNLPLAWPSLHRDPVGDALLDIVTWACALVAVLLAGWWAAGRAGLHWTIATARWPWPSWWHRASSGGTVRDSRRIRPHSTCCSIGRRCVLQLDGAPLPSGSSNRRPSRKPSS